ncbi:MAG: flagellar hook-associated protein FlgK, partial [Planctomycetota bacterium]
MGLTSALQIGRSGLVASQVGIQVASNNMSNAATPGYSRQVLSLAPGRDQLSGLYALGTGVGIRAVERQIDEALQTRLRESISNERASAERRVVLDQLESVMNELTGSDLSTNLSNFFNAFSDGANLIQSDAVLIEQGVSLASFMKSTRGNLIDLREQIEVQIDARTRRANELLTQIADINGEIATSEVGGATANGLRDRRDEMLGELAGYMDIDTVEDNRGIVDVYVASVPVVLAGQNLGLEVERVSD